MGTLFVGVVVFSLVALAAYNVFKNMRSGKGCGCSGCDNCRSCPDSTCE